ncbi:hypothetical protein HOB25_00025 [bacterium]|jgi:hypothetical protein|nr:hypothetical protein [Candidatus Neomarinimicrobiota bacterium]MBT6454117.1 hypothetical protein [Gammaproteobacteria bacterium]MBT6753358.1 hypothetical protein [bacterium]
MSTVQTQYILERLNEIITSSSINEPLQEFIDELKFNINVDKNKPPPILVKPVPNTKPVKYEEQLKLRLKITDQNNLSLIKFKEFEQDMHEDMQIDDEKLWYSAMCRIGSKYNLDYEYLVDWMVENNYIRTSIDNQIAKKGLF